MNSLSWAAAIQVLAAALAQHPTEVADQLINGAQHGTPLQHPGEIRLVGLGAVNGRADDPPGDLAGFGRDYWDCGRRCGAGAPRV
ncbi:hypothetical protein LWC34_56050 [Kibdelosporangium philippinense]|uniref:Uncharacterized protein n=1 Tax=Kibdelosporangium philippinense TaxID=211113 RepID=A0ABS8ZWI1_9PSEU|nr:hypothetical protein [Kibdelosporangium philippinense]MCE7012068.1 hypothetical protein [Kibdelosporangium philippinense]